MPLLQDVQAAGKSPSQVAEQVKAGLADYVRDPMVTVIVQNVTGAGTGKVSVIGEIGGGAIAAGGGVGAPAQGSGTPRSVTYRAGLTLLDVMIEVGGLSPFANGNDSRLVRVVNGKPKEFRLRIADLMKDGDTSANVELAPGDVIRVPERWF
jgi:polysaccharide export outer membrane protein